MNLRENALLIAGSIIFVWILLLPKPGNMPWSIYDEIKSASATLKGQTPFSDFAAEVVGFRALYRKTDPYPMLGEAFKDIGIDWPVMQPHSHPPTSVLFAAPVAFLPWPWASALWAWLMLGLIVISYRCYGLSWKNALGLMPITLLWPPTAHAIGSVTIIWLFGIAMAYHFRKTRPLLSGVCIGIASATKYWAGLVLILFVLKRKWRAVLGFISVWVVGLATVTIMNSKAIPRHLEVLRETSAAIIHRTDNQAPLVAVYRHAGWIGVVLMLLFFALIVFANRDYFLGRKASSRAWMLLSYFSVALLPTAYVYALMPLAPVIVFLLCRNKFATTLIAAYCILIPCIYTAGGDAAVIPMASVSIAIGLGFLVDVLPVKAIQKKIGSSFGIKEVLDHP